MRNAVFIAITNLQCHPELITWNLKKVGRYFEKNANISEQLLSGPLPNISFFPCPSVSRPNRPMNAFQHYLRLRLQDAHRSRQSDR